MKALDNAKKCSPEEVFARIASSGLKEYGVYREPVADRWSRILTEEEEKGNTLVVGLNNSDTTGILLDLLKKYPKEIMEGIKIAAYALRVEKLILQLPEYGGRLNEELSGPAKENGIEIVTGFINTRAYKGCYINHIVTMKNLYDIFAGQYEEGTYISVNGGELKKYPDYIKLNELIEDDNLKGLIIGGSIYPPTVLDNRLKDLNIPDGVIKTLTDKDCIVHEVEERLSVYRSQSCGKCVFCREGLNQLHGMLHDTTEGKGKEDYINIINEIGSAMINNTLCSLGKESAKVALSSLEYFSQEYEDHIKKKKCDANICISFQKIYIDPVLCKGCEECLDVCPQNCIDGKQGYIHMIDEFECTRCGQCIEVCEYGAIIQTTGRVPKLPDRLIKCSKFKKH